MAKYSEILPENDAVFTEVINSTSLDGNVNIKILACNTLKEIGKVIKANDLVKHMTSEDIVIVINEVIFDKLEEQQKLIVADTLIAAVGYNGESGKVTIEKPDMCVFTGVIKKYTFPICERVHETIKSLFEHEKHKKDGTAEPDSELPKDEDEDENKPF